MKTRLMDQAFRDLEPAVPATVSKSVRAEALDAPVSDLQKGLYFVQRLAPESAAYNLVFSARVLSPIDYGLFATCVQALVDRHASLRAGFSDGARGEPQQRFFTKASVDFSIVDAATLTDGVLYEELLKESRRPFDLGRPPLWRVRLYRCTEVRHLLLLTAHHIAVDFWSLAILLDELRTLYTALGHRVIPSLSRKIPDYPDFIAWQQKALESEDSHRSLEYWRQCLAGTPSVLNLPTSRPRSAQQTYRGSSLGFRLTDRSTVGLRELARAEGATLYMVLLAAYHTLLFRYTAQEDILVGSPVACRSRPEFRSVVGNFTNLIVLRSAPEAQKTFRTFLREVRDRVIEALRHQNYPFARLVEQLAPERDASRSPLVQACFAWERLPLFRELSEFFTPGGTVENVQFGDFELEPYVLPQQEGQFDVTLEMGAESNGELTGVLKYNSDLFEAPFIAAMAEHFRVVVAGIAADADCALWRLPLLAGGERQQLLRDWNRTERHYRGVSGVHALFEAQVLRSPNSLAVTHGNQSLSYFELNHRANRLANWLRRRDLGRGDKVAICMERGLEMVVALLGTLKAGVCYVPLDPGFPPKRLALAVEDAKPALVLTNSSGTLPDVLEGLPQLRLDGNFGKLGDLSGENPELEVHGEDLAYVIFTSGSTGRPKGVQISHRAVVNFLKAMSEQPGLDPSDVLLSVTTLSFDIAVLEIFLPLTVGARTILANRETAADPKLLEHALRHHRATVMQATPGTWRMLIDAGCELPSDLTMLCGGERLPRALADKLLGHGKALWNLYGPTETTVWSTAHRVERGDGEVPLGRPIANTRVYVLDPKGQPVPVSVPGELYIGGAGVAAGYLERPELGREKFIVDRTLDPSGGLIYRTGDRVRYRSDGTLEYLGRFGDQVKLRGYRIELGDIEANLREHPQINDVVVVLQSTSESDAFLTAFFQPRQDNQFDTEDLRGFLKECLPPYMVPAHFVPVDAFPLTPNGKVDRLALQERRPQREAVRQDYMAPRDAMEIELVRIFEELLERQPISVTDDFFHLGGHSLLAVRLVTEIKRRLDIELALSELLKHSTVETLGSVLRQTEKRDTSILVSLRGDGDKPPLFLMHPIGGTVFCYLALARQANWNRPILAVQAPSVARTDEAMISVEEMAERYVEVIRQRQPEGPYYLGGWCFGGVIAFEVARQLERGGQAVALVALLDSRAPIPDNAPADGDDALLLSWFARDLATPYGKTLQIAPEHLRSLPGEEKLRYVLTRATEIGILPKDADCTLLQRYFEVYLANGMALQTYAPRPYSGRVVLLRARDESANYGPDLGWSGLVEQLVEVRPVPGDHNSLMYEPHVGCVTEELKGFLDRALD
jgi:amino acid adenylation domain-containing protein